MTSKHESSPAKKHCQWSTKNKKGTRHVLILAIPRNTTKSVSGNVHLYKIERVMAPL